MAYTFDSTTDRITWSPGAAFPQTGSLALWFKPTWAQTDGVDHQFFHLFIDAAPTEFGFEKKFNNSFYVGWYVGGVGDFRLIVTSANYSITQNAWNHLAVTWDDTANSTILYVNGTSVGTKSGLSTVSSTATRTLGNYASGRANVNCASDLAEFAIWEVVLDASQITMLNNCMSPRMVATDGLTDYLPLIRELSNYYEPIATAANTAVANHPRMIYPAKQNTHHGYNSVTGSYGGTVTPTGALVKVVKPVYAGTITPAGTLTVAQIIARIFSGTLTPMGTLVKIAIKSVGLGGTVTPSGTLTRNPDTHYAGEITPSGALATSFAKFFSGSITPTGAVSWVASVSFAGVLAPIGALRKIIGKFFGGGITPSGDVTTATPGKPKHIDGIVIYHRNAVPVIYNRFAEAEVYGRSSDVAPASRTSTVQYSSRNTGVEVVS